ncbi:hypothetical protein LCGC14_2048530, partial [marine sediment metagenome]
ITAITSKQKAFELEQKATKKNEAEKRRLEENFKNQLIKARAESEKLLKEKQEAELLRRKQSAQFETQKDNAFTVIDRANLELDKDNFEAAIELYKKSEIIFTDINWQEGLKMIKDSITAITSKQKAFELEQKATKKNEAEKQRLEENFKNQLIKARAESEKLLKEKKKSLLLRKEQSAQFEAQKDKAFTVIDRANLELDKNNFEAAIELYKKSEIIFTDINWQEGLKMIKDSITAITSKQKAFELEQKATKKNEAEKRRLEENFKNQLIKARAESEKLLKEKQEAELLRRKQSAQFETQKDKAFTVIDRAKQELNQNNFKAAIELYKKSEIIFVEVDWQEGLKMVKESIIIIKNKHQAFELKQKKDIEIEKKKLVLEEKFEEEFAKAEETRMHQQEEKRKELQKIQREKEQEKNMSENAYKLLELGTALLERNEFDEAYEKYIAARKLFQNISWKREVSRINNDLLLKLKRERKKFELLELKKQKEVEDLKEMEVLKEETKRERQKLEKRKKEEKRRLAKEKREKKITQKLQKANRYIENSKYNEAVLIMIEEIDRLSKLGNQDEINKINEQISYIKSQAQIPLITTEKLIEERKFKNFELAYLALDKAQISLDNNRIMKAISELNEAKFNLKVLKIGNKYIKEIDTKINELKVKLGQAPTQEIDEKEKEEKEKEMLKASLEARIARRREERRKKVLNLLKKK